MSAVSNLRNRWHYDKDVPRCETCINYKRPGHWMLNSLPRTSPPWCKLGEFRVSPTALCEHWCTKKGETLE